jgi:hypothetical protein
LLTRAWVRPTVIVSVLVVLLLLNAREFKSKRRALEEQFRTAEAADASLRFTRHQALQAQTIEQLLHMIHTMLAAILAALLWS